MDRASARGRWARACDVWRANPTAQRGRLNDEGSCRSDTSAWPGSHSRRDSSKPARATRGAAGATCVVGAGGAGGAGSCGRSRGHAREPEPGQPWGRSRRPARRRDGRWDRKARHRPSSVRTRSSADGRNHLPWPPPSNRPDVAVNAVRITSWCIEETPFLGVKSFGECGVAPHRVPVPPNVEGQAIGVTVWPNGPVPGPQGLTSVHPQTQVAARRHPTRPSGPAAATKSGRL